MSSQEIIIEVNGISRETVLDIIEHHQNLAYRYINQSNDEVEITLTQYEEDDFEVEMNIEDRFGTMMKFDSLSPAMDQFFDLIERNPCEIEEENNEDED